MSEKISKLFSPYNIYNINCSFRYQLPFKNLICKDKPHLPPSDILNVVYKIIYIFRNSGYVGEYNRKALQIYGILEYD